VDQNATTSSVACPDCHALVEDLDAHKKWHSRVVASIANAVERELDRRSPSPA
jgi:hypothetical protein